MESCVGKIVTKIEANPLLAKHNNENALLRVAAYCRVSTDSNDQLESYKAQVAHYTEAIAKNPRWRFVDIYADEGITGTSTKKRSDFQRMIRDCEKGKIDMILTKSVARFARNTVDSLNYVRKLKGMNVGVFFEEQNLDSLKADSEMFIGLHSVLAQAESETISANVRWGIRQRMRTGTFAFRYNLLGYRKGDDGLPKIYEPEAEIIRLIFKLFLEGDSLAQIKDKLEEKGYKTFKGNDKWERKIIHNILMNERYCGDLMLQKTFTENCITKKVKINRGEVDRYFIDNNHPAIISKLIYKKAQMELSKRSTPRKVSSKGSSQQGKYSGKYAFSEILVCGECGSPFRRKTWVYKQNKRIVWRCLSRIENGTKFCKDSVSVDEEELQNAVIRALSNGVNASEEVAQMCKANLAYVTTGKDEALDVFAIQNQLNEIEKQMDETVALKKRSSGDGKNFEEVMNLLSAQTEILLSELEVLQNKIINEDDVSEEVLELKGIIEERESMFQQYDEVLVRRTIEHIRIMKDGELLILLKGGRLLKDKVKIRCS